MRSALLATNEESARVCQVIQRERIKRKSVTVETLRRLAIPDYTPLGQPTSQGVSAQWSMGTEIDITCMSYHRARETFVE